MMKKMIIVGGGAAGMMTAILAAKNYKVTLLEKNEKLGKKLFITGKGRCNLTNACDEETFLKNVMSNPKFLYSAIYSCNSEQVMKYFTDWGLSIKTERGNRVFPVSDHSSDVIRTLERGLERCGVKVRLNTKVNRILTEPIEEKSPWPYGAGVSRVADIENKEELYIEEPYADKKMDKQQPLGRVTGVMLDSGEKLYADKVVLATGGISYPGTGASGECVAMLENLGINTRPFQPSLVPFESDLSICRPLMGLSLKNVEVSFYRASKPKKPIYQEFGEMLFTHFGVSGPIILSASGKLQKYFGTDRKPREELYLLIDWKPALDMDQLDARILREFDQAKNKNLQNVMETLLPKAAVPFVLGQAGISPEEKVHEVTQENRRKITETLKGFRLPIRGVRGFDEAIISAGGISVKEIDPKTMELKRLPGLRVAGEMIDCDALTGGFNLQIAWCTAYLAAQ